MTKPNTTKPSKKGKSRSKGAKYNGVALPEDATQRRRLRNKLSAQVHRKRKQDALNAAKEEVECCDVVINKLKTQLNDTRTKICSLQSIMDSIQLELGVETVQHIFAKCNQKAGVINITAARSVTSESDTNISSSSDDDSSIGCIREEGCAI